MWQAAAGPAGLVGFTKHLFGSRLYALVKQQLEGSQEEQTEPEPAPSAGQGRAEKTVPHSAVTRSEVSEKVSTNMPADIPADWKFWITKHSEDFEIFASSLLWRKFS